MEISAYQRQIDTTAKSIDVLSKSVKTSDKIEASAKTLALAVLVFGESLGQAARAVGNVALTVILLPLSPAWKTARPGERLVSVYNDATNSITAFVAAPLLAAAAFVATHRVKSFCVTMGLLTVTQSFFERVKSATKNVLCHRVFKITVCALTVAAIAAVVVVKTAEKVEEAKGWSWWWLLVPAALGVAYWKQGPSNATVKRFGREVVAPGMSACWARVPNCRDKVQIGWQQATARCRKQPAPNPNPNPNNAGGQSAVDPATGQATPQKQSTT